MTDDNEQIFLTAAQVRKRYGGRSDMWLWRMARDEIGWPRPLLIRGNRYWRLTDLLDYENQAREVANAEAS